MGAPTRDSRLDLPPWWTARPGPLGPLGRTALSTPMALGRARRRPTPLDARRRASSTPTARLSTPMALGRGRPRTAPLDARARASSTPTARLSTPPCARHKNILRRLLRCLVDPPPPKKAPRPRRRRRRSLPNARAARRRRATVLVASRRPLGGAARARSARRGTGGGGGRGARHTAPAKRAEGTDTERDTQPRRSARRGPAGSETHSLGEARGGDRPHSLGEARGGDRQ
jgi:hypothetical protein